MTVPHDLTKAEQKLAELLTKERLDKRAITRRLREAEQEVIALRVQKNRGWTTRDETARRLKKEHKP